MPTVETVQSAWENFYVILGSSAAGLTGLTFVVIALAADAHMARLQGLRTFVTPTMLHFSSVLVIAALMSIPGHTRITLAVTMAVAGALGVLYTLVVNYRMLASADYTPVFSDWAWNGILPVCAYGTLLGCGLRVAHNLSQGALGIGLADLLLLLIGIHNAWDIAIWITAERPDAQRANDDQPPAANAVPSERGDPPAAAR